MGRACTEMKNNSYIFSLNLLKGGHRGHKWFKEVNMGHRENKVVSLGAIEGSQVGHRWEGGYESQGEQSGVTRGHRGITGGL